MRLKMETVVKLMIFVNFVIPKCGTKIGGFPLYLGTVLLLLLIANDLLRMNHAASTTRIRTFFRRNGIMVVAMVLLQLALLPTGLGSNAIDSFTVLVLMPYAYCLILSSPNVKYQNIIRPMLYVVFAYGLLQFTAGHQRTMIPGITINWADAGISDIYSLKHGGFGDLIKLSSTYQGGNTFALNMVLVFFPFVFLAFAGEKLRQGFTRKSRGPLLLMGLACILLSLSRTAYFAIVFCVILLIIGRGVRKAPLIVLAGIGLSVILAVLPNIPHVVRVYERVFLMFDTSLGGRMEPFVTGIRHYFHHPLHLLLGGGKEGGAYEMTYALVLFRYGMPILILFVAVWFLPPLGNVLRWLFRTGKVSKKALPFDFAITVYAVAAFFEGALWLPPTAINFWIIRGFADRARFEERTIEDTQSSIEDPPVQLVPGTPGTPLAGQGANA